LQVYEMIVRALSQITSHLEYGVTLQNPNVSEIGP
jgi:hypothetical protein